jgi:general stress protein 26
MRPYVPRSIRQLRRLLKDMPIGMLTTQTQNGASHSRPMVVHGVDASGWLWFLTDRHSRKACELSQNPLATVAFQSRTGDRYVSVQGTAVVIRDDVKLRQLWTPTLRFWFPRGRRHDDVVLVAVRVTRAEYWLLPRTRIASALKRVKAMVMGKRHPSANHGILDLHPLIT